jgi:ribonuclease P protein component
MFSSSLGSSRFAFVVRRDAGTAVKRNLVKRRLREVARMLAIAPGWDIVVSAHRSAASVSFGELRKDVEDLLRRGRLLDAGPS